MWRVKRSSEHPPANPERTRQFGVLTQAVGFVSSSVIVRVVGAIASVLLARALTTSALGSYSFATSFVTLVALLFEFGLITAASRLAAIEGDPQSRDYFGSSLIAFVPIGLGFLLVVWAMSFWVNGWFNVHIGSAIRTVLPLLLVFPFAFVTVQLASGMKRLHVYSVTSAAGTILYLVAIASAEITHVKLSVTVALALASGTLLIGQVWLVGWLRPRFGEVAKRLRSLVAASRQYSFALYVGRVLSIGTYNMDVLMVAGFSNAKQVAFYNLAGAIAAIVVYPGTAVAASLYPHLVHEDQVERKWLVLTWTLGVAATVAAALLAHPVIRIVLAQRYLPAAPLVLPLSLAATVRGVTGLYNSFLTAHGKGKELRNAGFALTASNLVFNFALIPPFGAAGAAWASLIALLINLAAHLFYYRRIAVAHSVTES